MNREDLETVANGIFNIVKHDVMMNIEKWITEIIEADNEDDEVNYNVVENHDRILNYCNDDDYLMSLLLDYLEKVIIEEEDLLIFGFYHCSSIRSAIDYILSEINSSKFKATIKF